MFFCSFCIFGQQTYLINGLLPGDVARYLVDTLTSGVVVQTRPNLSVTVDGCLSLGVAQDVTRLYPDPQQIYVQERRE